MYRQNKWDIRFLQLAKFWGELCSKDPSTKVGAVITRDTMRIVSIGYNGFPIGVEDSVDRLNDREVKYAYTCHAEINAIISARCDLSACTMYVWPLLSCNDCAKAIIQAGITRIVYPAEDSNERWNKSHEYAISMYREASVSVLKVDIHDKIVDAVPHIFE
jgi:dCMP deaminase